MQDRDDGPDGLQWALLFLALFVGLAVLSWMLFKPAIAGAMIWAGSLMAGMLSWFTDRYDVLLWQLSDADPAHSSVTFPRLWRMLTLVGWPFAIPAAGFLLFLAVRTYRRVRVSQYAKELNLDGLMREQVENFGFIAPFAARRIGAVAPRKTGEPRPLDPLLSVEEWVARNALDSDGRFSDAMAEAALARQLGPVWRGPEVAAPHVRCLFVAFSLHASRRRAEARHILSDLASALPRPEKGEGPAGPEVALVLPGEIVEDTDRWLRHPAVRPAWKVAARHAFTAPAMMSVLTAAREPSGILNCGQFAWLQFVDRSLFAALDTLGFPVEDIPWHLSPAPSPNVEGIGARAHWQAEMEAPRGEVRPIWTPMVGLAVPIIRDAYHDVLAAEQHPYRGP